MPAITPDLHEQLFSVIKQYKSIRNGDTADKKGGVLPQILYKSYSGLTLVMFYAWH